MKNRQVRSNQEQCHEPEQTGVQVTELKEVETTVQILVENFQGSLSKFRRHIFNIRHQYAVSRELRGKMITSECIIHIDFSENFSCRYSREIQSVHFGASHQQCTLHTGVLYIGDVEDPVSFCTISPSRRHDPPAIWAYMEPILSYVRNNFPDVSLLHFYSDGPTTQYRQKGNFFLFSTIVHRMGFEGATWHFWEASHGKGAPDGVGGALKRSGDKLIALGRDITNAESLYRQLLTTETSVKLFYTEADEVGSLASKMPEKLPTVVGTMRLHQLVTVNIGEIYFRDVSCVCSSPGDLLCNCYGLKRFNFSQHAFQDGEATGQRAAQPTPLENEVQDGVQPEPRRSDHAAENGLDRLEGTDGLVGEMVAVRYDSRPYPGKVLAVEEDDVQVLCMCKTGINKFFWPTREDICWYQSKDVICRIPEPTKAGSGSCNHFQVDPNLWPLIEDACK